ncbi:MULTISPECIES: GNAT family N-acetyltransferase [Vibrio]|uniref:GNAT family N-acetyltransferase n=2 Tax=Vibrio TaxID=662 RepID=A0A7X4LLG2_9VIBR|nr:MULTISPECIES: GNAT family N-acetyltransferase [Vibrio]MBF9000279.1 GNAT family N-acetyltransferase [Vibrio nitrifigilis]MZI94155.1 GNAT family N-acetyltransferase [Vibrio eleionomae]
MSTEIIIADYTKPAHAEAIVSLMVQYAADPMGGGSTLSKYVQENLVAELSRVPNAFSVLAFVDGIPAGLINCLQGFSTFKCKPLINIHDVVVGAEFRGQGLSQGLLAKVEEVAKERGCCKLTLEVLSGNDAAKQTYQKFGFAGYELDPEAGHALFWQKEF